MVDSAYLYNIRNDSKLDSSGVELGIRGSVLLLTPIEAQKLDPGGLTQELGTQCRKWRSQHRVPADLGNNRQAPTRSLAPRRTGLAGEYCWSHFLWFVYLTLL